jgi:hypothetical protein
MNKTVATSTFELARLSIRDTQQAISSSGYGVLSQVDNLKLIQK